MPLFSFFCFQRKIRCLCQRSFHRVEIHRNVYYRWRKKKETPKNPTKDTWISHRNSHNTHHWDNSAWTRNSFLFLPEAASYKAGQNLLYHTKDLPWLLQQPTQKHSSLLFTNKQGRQLFQAKLSREARKQHMAPANRIGFSLAECQSTAKITRKNRFPISCFFFFLL